MKKILQLIRTRLANAQVKLRLLTMLAFLIFAYLGMNSASDLASMMTQAKVDPGPLNVAVPDGLPRLLLLGLSVIITVASVITAFGAWRRSSTLRAWIVVMAGYMLYGLYLMAVALIELKNPLAAATGAAYLAISAAAFSFGRQASLAMGIKSW